MVNQIVAEARRFYDPGCSYEIPIPETSLFSLLEDAASSYPDRIVLDYFAKTMSYWDLYEFSLRAAGVLWDARARKGDVIAIALPNCPQALIVFYACMRIGAVAAQHSPLAPVEEIADQLRRHDAKIAVVWEKCASNFSLGNSALETLFVVDITYHMPVSKRVALDVPPARVRKLREQMRSSRPHNTRSFDLALASARRVDEDVEGTEGLDRAIILHTGGTNGVPKSVPLTHRNIGASVNQCFFWVRRLHESAETFFSLLPYLHAFGLTFFCCAAVRKAATQIILPKFDVDLALEAHRRRPVTFFVGVPPMFERLERQAAESGDSLRSIRYSVAGTMPFSVESAKRWEEATGRMTVKGYGLTETSPVLMGAPLSPSHRHGVLGLPSASAEVHLVDLDDPSRDVAEGEPGETLVRDPQALEGYLDAPEETARVFTGGGWFRTGDIGALGDGFLRITNRKKELILSGGLNVYPSQVEAAIRGLPGVKDVAVVGLPNGDEKEEVAATLVLEDDAPAITVEQVRLWAERRVFHYALPRVVSILVDLPRNPLGKVMCRKVREQLLTARQSPSSQDGKKSPVA